MRTEILYEDKDLLVCYKPAGIPTQTKQTMQMDVESELKNYLKGKPVYVVHRLDQPVEGILVFGKTKEAAAALGKQLSSDEMNKEYYAVVAGIMEEKQGKLVDHIKFLSADTILNRNNCTNNFNRTLGRANKRMIK